MCAVPIVIKMRRTVVTGTISFTPSQSAVAISTIVALPAIVISTIFPGSIKAPAVLHFTASKKGEKKTPTQGLGEAPISMRLGVSLV
jgi:hypothetical protein